MISYDHGLVHRANQNSGGANAHTIANLLAGYKMSYGFYLDDPCRANAALVMAAEKALRKYLRSLEQRN